MLCGARGFPVTVRPHVSDRGQDLLMWRGAASILNTQPRRADNKGLSSVWGLGGELKRPQRKGATVQLQFNDCTYQRSAMAASKQRWLTETSALLPVNTICRRSRDDQAQCLSHGLFASSVSYHCVPRCPCTIRTGDEINIPQQSIILWPELGVATSHAWARIIKSRPCYSYSVGRKGSCEYGNKPSGCNWLSLLTQNFAIFLAHKVNVETIS